MGKPSTSKIEVNEYMMSLHYGICSGPVDALLEILVDEKSAWSGTLTGTSEFTISKSQLFGGPKKEGGVVGSVRYLAGDSAQVMPNHLAAKFGRTSATMPAFRGISSLFFFGSSGRKGFVWKSNVPYLPGMWAKVRRRSRGLTEALAMIGPDSNPAHMIYECLTDQDWGMGAPASLINVPSFESAAQTLYNESFGLSMIWTKQTTIETFITEILDHIQATFYVDPTTGLMTLKLIRADYNPATLPVLTPDNCKVTKFARKLWGETINEVVVTWTNPVNEKEETVYQQDLANITQQGSIVSDGRNYYGVRNSVLATKLARRDLRTASFPVASFEIDVDRSGWDLLPGGLVKLTYPEHGVYDLVLRIGPVNYGKPGSPTIKITATEDIFTQQIGAYVIPPSSGWVDPSEEPEPMEFVRPFTLPAFMVVSAVGEALSSGVYPEVYLGFLATQDSPDTYSYELVGEVVQPNGDVTFEQVGSKSLVGRATLQAPLSAEAMSTVVSFPNVIGPVQPGASVLVFIGDGADAAMEIALIRSSSEAGWQLDRGVLDTVPRSWPAGTPVWFINAGDNIYDSRVQSAADTVDYKLLPRTSKGVLNEAAAPLVSVVASDRPHAPLRPANVTVGGTAFGTLAGAGFGPWDVTWSNRNRLTEDSQILGWSAGDVAPEAGQTTTIQVLNASTRAVITTINGLTGTTHSLPKSAFGGQSSGIVRVTSKRDGLESLQGHEITLTGIT